MGARKRSISALAVMRCSVARVRVSSNSERIMPGRYPRAVGSVASGVEPVGVSVLPESAERSSGLEVVSMRQFWHDAPGARNTLRAGRVAMVKKRNRARACVPARPPAPAPRCAYIRARTRKVP